MKNYRVVRDYRAHYREEDIVLVEGATVTLDEETAAWVERDSPGTLREVAAGQDRMAREGKTR